MPPETSDWKISADLWGKREEKWKGGKWRRKDGKMLKGRWKIENGMREKFQNEERTFFCLLFKTTKICFGSTQMEIFYREKAFHAGKKSGKITLPPQKNFPVTPLLGGNIDENLIGKIT